MRLWETLILVVAVLAARSSPSPSARSTWAAPACWPRPAVLAAGSLFLAAVAVPPGGRAAAVIRSARLRCSRPRAGALPWALVALLVGYLVVFAAWPEVNSFSAIGARPDGGGRFYGAGNLVETVLLTVSLEAAALLGRLCDLPVFVLALVAVGWSQAGADGGGIVVLMAPSPCSPRRMYDVRWTCGARVGGLAGGRALVAAMVGLDAASGGSSHVTHAFRSGPVSLAEELATACTSPSRASARAERGDGVRRLDHLAVVLGSAGRVSPPATPCSPGIAVSLLVNDSPGDVASAGALSYAVLLAYERVRQPARAVARADNVGPDAPGFASRA